MVKRHNFSKYCPEFRAWDDVIQKFEWAIPSSSYGYSYTGSRMVVSEYVHKHKTDTFPGESQGHTWKLDTGENVSVEIDGGNIKVRLHVIWEAWRFSQGRYSKFQGRVTGDGTFERPPQKKGLDADVKMLKDILAKTSNPASREVLEELITLLETGNPEGYPPYVAAREGLLEQKAQKLEDLTKELDKVFQTTWEPAKQEGYEDTLLEEWNDLHEQVEAVFPGQSFMKMKL